MNKWHNYEECEGCDNCCNHEEYDHDVCLYCGYERDPGELIDTAQDAVELGE